MKTITGIQITDLSTKWGLVSVSNPDGTINREYAITGAEADAVANGNNIVPSGCTDEEWFSGRTTLSCRPCNPGQGILNEDGSLVVNYGVSEKAGKVDIKLMQIFPAEYTLDKGVLSIDAAVAAQVDVPFTQVK